VTYTPLPVPSIVDSLERLRHKGGKRWRDADGFIYEHDPLHGDLEKYDRRGRHRGSVDPVTGVVTKPAERGRRLKDV
jgi:hypothetical protein